MDYDYSAEEVGLAEGFQPSVKVSCVGGTMKIRVDTLTPFQGIIHGPNRTEPGCSVMGKSGLKTYLNIDLTRPEGALVNIIPTYPIDPKKVPSLSSATPISSAKRTFGRSLL